MITLFLQLIGSLLTALFGVLALRVYGRSEDRSSGRPHAWRLVGLCYTLMGIHVTVQSIAAVFAFFAPEGSWVLTSFLKWQVVGNDGRGFLVLGFAALLLFVVIRRELQAAPRSFTVIGWYMIWLLAGSAVGVAELGMGDSHHFSTITYLSAATVVVLLSVLLIAVITDQLDYLLWSALGLYVLREVLDVSLTSLFALFDLPGAWIPSYRSMQALVVVCYSLLCLLAAKRLSLRQGLRSVPALFELDGSVETPRSVKLSH